ALKDDDVAQEEIPHKRIRGAGHRKISNEPMPCILIRRSPFQTSAKDILRNTDESRKRSVIQSMRECVTGVEVHIFPRRLVHLQRAAVIHRISGEIVATNQTGRVARNSTVIILACRIARRWRSGRGAWVRAARNSLDGTKVTECGPQQVMRCDKEVAAADGEPATDLPINLQAGLFRIRNGAVPIRVAVPDRSRSRNTM